MATLDYQVGSHDASEGDFEDRVLEYDAAITGTYNRIMNNNEELVCMRVVTDDSVQTLDSAAASLGYRRI